MPKLGTYLGFDFGTKQVGVAIGDTVTASARPLTTLPADNGVVDSLLISPLVHEWAPVGFVVGLPLTPEGEKGIIAHAATRFANRLQATFHLPSYQIDERLTTQIARKLSADHPLDAKAAALILEAWLNSL